MWASAALPFKAAPNDVWNQVQSVMTDLHKQNPNWHFVLLWSESPIYEKSSSGSKEEPGQTSKMPEIASGMHLAKNLFAIVAMRFSIDTKIQNNISFELSKRFHCSLIYVAAHTYYLKKCAFAPQNYKILSGSFCQWMMNCNFCIIYTGIL